MSIIYRGQIKRPILTKSRWGSSDGAFGACAAQIGALGLLLLLVSVRVFAKIFWLLANSVWIFLNEKRKQNQSYACPNLNDCFIYAYTFPYHIIYIYILFISLYIYLIHIDIRIFIYDSMFLSRSNSWSLRTLYQGGGTAVAAGVR